MLSDNLPKLPQAIMLLHKTHIVAYLVQLLEVAFTPHLACCVYATLSRTR